MTHAVQAVHAAAPHAATLSHALTVGGTEALAIATALAVIIRVARWVPIGSDARVALAKAAVPLRELH
jgi:hypothetical protein